jgi:membrane-bound lytic murein transglycosylase MltF
MKTLLTVALAASATGLNQDIGIRKGDLDAMLEVRMVRVLVPYSRTLYFNDRGKQRGLTADTLHDFEIFLNKKFYIKDRPITVIALPTTRDQLLSGLVEGRGDLAAGNLTITAAREATVDFSKPIAEGVAEVVVTGRRSPKLASLDDLGGKEAHVRRSSTYYASLEALNKRLRSEGKPEVRIVAMPEALEDEDLMDMVAGGLLPFAVVDDWKARIWAGMHKTLKVRTDLALTSGENIGWAFRRGSPKFAAAVNEYIDLYPGSRAKRFKDYPQYLARLSNATATDDWKRFESTVALFRKYGARYKFDYLMLAAQGYQESRLDQNARSGVGAIGIMQLMPDTAAELKVGDITQAEPNVHGGAKYLRWLHDRFITGDAIDEQNRTLLAFAAYNAGPGRIAALRTEAAKVGLNPDVWFNNVELIAARRVGQETVAYVRNIYKYYIAYKLQLEALEARRAAAAVYEPPKPVAKKKPRPAKPAAAPPAAAK